jgi:hypothetical protein
MAAINNTRVCQQVVHFPRAYSHLHVVGSTYTIPVNEMARPMLLARPSEWLQLHRLTLSNFMGLNVALPLINYQVRLWSPQYCTVLTYPLIFG